MDTKTVGVIGLGLMDTRRTERLLETGYAVWVHHLDAKGGRPIGRVPGGTASAMKLKETTQP